MGGKERSPKRKDKTIFLSISDELTPQISRKTPRRVARCEDAQRSYISLLVRFAESRSGPRLPLRRDLLTYGTVYLYTLAEADFFAWLNKFQYF